MAKLLLDSNGNVNIPTIIMSNKALEKLGTIPYDYTSLEYNKNIGYSEASFVVYKTWTDELGNETECRFWDDLTDLSVVYIRDYDEYFEVEVSLDESDSISKTITLTSLHVAELSQINVYLEVNTEEDIDRDDYLFPTVFYNPSDASVSLLNRIIDEKASHYSIGTVPNTLRNIQRTFSWSGSSIWEAFEDIEEEIGCKFLVEGRTINVVDMMTTCSDCGYRGDYLTECPKCGGSNVTLPYGKFTNIYVSRENLSEDITLTTEDADSKNCFRLEAGDEDMTAAVINLNPSGSRYIYYFSDKLKSRISNGLKTALEQYEEDYETYKNNSYSFPLAHASDFDTLADKYNSNDYTVYKYNENNERVLTSNSFLKTDSVTSYAKLVEFYYDAYNFYYYLNDTLMPSVEVDIETAQGQLNRIKRAITNVGISGYDPAKTSNETVSNAIKMLCSAMIVGAFKVSVFCTKDFVEEGVYTYATTITVTNYRDDEDIASDTKSIIVSNDVEMTFVQQMQNNLKTYFEDRDSLNDSSIYRMIDYNDDDLTGFQEYLTYYNLADLDSFENAYNEVISVLEEQASSDLDDIETAYRNKLALISAEKVRRESEVEKIETLLEDVESTINSVKSALDMNTNYLTTKALQDEFNSYRREDTYENSNYSSEGLSDSELMERAAEFYETALTEVENATRTVYNINANIHNLLMMPEFESLWEDFEVCNWIAFRVDDKIFRLRILSYRIQFDEDSLATIDVDFTTATEGKTASLFGSTQQILQSAKSMATSYPYVKYQTNINKISVEEINALTALLNSQLANKNSDISNLTSNNIAMSGNITSLQADNVTINGRLTANEASIDTLEANDVTINGRLTANEASIGTLSANKADITDLTASNARITNLEAEYVTVSGTLEAHTGYIHNLEADTAKIHDLTANQISATVGYIGDLQSNNVTANNITATTGYISSLTSNNVTVNDLVATKATVESLDANYAQINLANVNNAWIENGVVRDAAISDAKIIGVSANKLTAGTIDASNINVANLRASNLIVDTVNGQPVIGGYSTVDPSMSEYAQKNPSSEGWYEYVNGNFVLSSDTQVDSGKTYYSSGSRIAFYNKSYIDNLANDLNSRIDGAIQTYMGADVPTLVNYPYTDWYDTTTTPVTDTRANHIGDIYYVVNAQSQANGYSYRFIYDNTTSTYDWILIQDSAITDALQRLLDVEGDISSLQSFENTTSSWITQTDSELSSLQSSVSSLSDSLGNKVDSSTFNTVSQQVDVNTANITSLTTTVNSKADGSTVTTLSNTVNTIQQTANSNRSTISNLTNILGTNSDGTTANNDIIHRTSTLEQDLSGFHTTVSQTYATKEELASEENQRKATFGTSSTDSGTGTKAVSCSNFELHTGSVISVKFDNANTNSSPSLNVNSTEAIAIKSFKGETLSASEYGWAANSVLDFIYDGTNWRLLDNGMASRVTTAESSITQNANNIALKVSESDVTGNYLVGKINLSSTTAQIEAERVNIAGAAIFNSYYTKTDIDETVGTLENSIPTKVSDLNNDSSFATTSQVATAKSEAISTASSDATTKANNAVTSANSYTDTVTSDMATNTGVAGTYASKSDAIAQEQRVYYKSTTTSAPAAPTSAWVTSTSTVDATWTTKRMQYDTGYPYLFTCIQKQTVGGTITCTAVLLDDTTTVIDGGKIITNSITANKLSTDAIKSNGYVAGASGSPYSAIGTFLDLANGNIYTPNFGVQALTGTAYLNGEIIATSGTIGDDSGNYWSIGNTTDSNGDTSASIIGNGTAYIQDGYFQISNGSTHYSNGTINTQWYAQSVGGGYSITYPYYDSTYWDFGMSAPILDTSSDRYNANTSNNFLYIRKHANTIPVLESDWTYTFKVDKDGNAYVNNLYVNGTSIAQMIESGVDGGAYLSTSGGTVNGNVTITGTLTATADKALKDGNGSTITSTYHKLSGSNTNSATNTFSGANTFSGNVTISKTSGLNYSGISSSSTNANTYVWFSKSGTEGTPVYDNDFKYNPSTNTLTVGSITGTADKALKDGSGNTITSTYAPIDDAQLTGDTTLENVTVSGTASFTNGITGDVSGNASSATRLTSSAGSATHPIYFSDGVPVATTYELNKSVPSNAVFTDTNWYHTTGTWSGLTYTAGKSNNSMDALAFTIPTGTTATTVALGNHTHNYASKVNLSGTDYSSSSSTITITKANLQNAIQDSSLVLMTSEERSKLASIQVSEGGTIDFSGVTATAPLSATVDSTDGTVTISHNTSGITAGTYRSVTVDTYGHVTAGTNPTTLSGYGITDAKIASGVITLGNNTITPLVASSTLDASKLSGTASVSTTGNASTSSALATSGTIRTNLASTSAVTYTSGGNITPGVTGTLGVGNGGTGQTSAKNAANAFMNALETGSTTPIDADYYISQYVGGGTTTTTYHRRPMSALWAYIKSKIGNDTSTLDGMYVKLSTAQTIGGAKTFSDTATFNSLIQANGNLTIQGSTTNSTVYDATNPKITFKNSGGNQNIQLIFSDFDTVVSPASLTLVGNQTSTNGGERFIAPNVRVNNRFEYGTNAYTVYNTTDKSIDFIFN